MSYIETNILFSNDTLLDSRITFFNTDNNKLIQATHQTII